VTYVYIDVKYIYRVFQEWYHLEVTGELDKETIELMNAPRCGNADHAMASALPKPYVLGNY
jgi:hypothetical protein